MLGTAAAFLQLGDPDVMTWECSDKARAVTIELLRVKS